MRDKTILHNLKETLISLKHENGHPEPEPLISEVEGELGEEATIFDDDKMKKIKEMEAELALSDEEFEKRLI